MSVRLQKRFKKSKLALVSALTMLFLVAAWLTEAQPEIFRDNPPKVAQPPVKAVRGDKSASYLEFAYPNLVEKHPPMHGYVRRLLPQASSLHALVKFEEEQDQEICGMNLYSFEGAWFVVMFPTRTGAFNLCFNLYYYDQYHKPSPRWQLMRGGVYTPWRETTRFPDLVYINEQTRHLVFAVRKGDTLSPEHEVSIDSDLTYAKQWFEKRK